MFAVQDSYKFRLCVYSAHQSRDLDCLYADAYLHALLRCFWSSVFCCAEWFSDCLTVCIFNSYERHSDTLKCVFKWFEQFILRNTSPQ